MLSPPDDTDFLQLHDEEAFPSLLDDPAVDASSLSVIRDYAAYSGTLMVASLVWWIVHYIKAQRDSKISAIHRENARLAAIARSQEGRRKTHTPPSLVEEDDEDYLSYYRNKVVDKKYKKRTDGSVFTAYKKVEEGQSPSLSKIDGAKYSRPASSAAPSKEAKEVAASTSSSLFYTRADDLSPVVYNDGTTQFIHVPHLPASAVAHATLQRLAKEFLPILRKRNYNVRIVSELCCCTDGVHNIEQQKSVEKEGELWKKKFKKNIDGHREDDCLGYNHIFRPSMLEQQVSHIYLRLREVHNHYKFLPYKQLVGTMSHELAHCIHADHSAEFWKLKEEIELEHQRLYNNTAAGSMVDKDGALAGYDGFNIYGSSPSRLKAT